MSFKILPQVLESLSKGFNSFNKFEAVVSNPPYMELLETNGYTSIYHHFLKVSKKFSKLVSMIYPTRWMLGGRGENFEEFRKEELNSSNYVDFVVDSDDSAVFTAAIIKGVVNYFLWDFAKTSKNVSYSYNGDKLVRETLIHGLPVMVQSNEAIAVINKVNPVITIKAFQLENYGTNYKTPKMIEDWEHKIKDGIPAIKVYYSSKGGGVRSGMVPEYTALRDPHNFKVFASKNR